MKMDLLVMFENNQVIFRIHWTSMTPQGGSSTLSRGIDKVIDQINRYAFSVVICSLTLIVIVVLIVGLLLGAIGFRRRTVPSDRTQLSNYGGIILIYL